MKPICSEPFSAASKGRDALFDVAGDIFDHDDRIVDHEPGRNRERHQRQIVQAVAEQIHHAERSHQRKRHRHAGDGGRRHTAEKQKDDEHDQRHGQHQLELHVRHGSADRGGAVGQSGKLDRGGQRSLELRQKVLDAIHHVDDVRARLPLNVDDHGGLVVFPSRQFDVFRAVNDVGHVHDADRGAVLVSDDDGLVRIGCHQLVVRPNRERLLGTVQIAFGLIDVRLPQRRAQIFQTQSIGRERRRVRLNPHRRLLAAADAHQTNPGQLRNFLR